MWCEGVACILFSMRRCVACLVITLILCSSALAVEPPDINDTVTPADSSTPGVLVLYSYSTLKGYTTRQQQGIAEALSVMRESDRRSGVTVYEEALVAESGRDPEAESRYADLLRYRYKDKRIDVIIAADTPAAMFMDRRWEEALPIVPMVMSAPVIVPPRFRDGSMPVTGVVEAMSARETLEIMRRVHPELRSISLLSRGRPIDDVAIDRVNEAASAFGITTDFLDQDPSKAIAHVRSLSVESAVVIAGMPAGWLREAFGEFMRESSRPIYCLYEGHLSHGAVGGVVASGYEYGKAAGAMAVRILRGQDVRTIPIVWHGVNKPIFDARQLSRWGIVQSMLPAGSEVRFKLPTWWDSHGANIVSGLLVLAVATPVIIAFAWLWRREARARRALAEREFQLSTIARRAPAVVYRARLRPDGVYRLEYASEAYEEVFGRPPNFNDQIFAIPSGIYVDDDRAERMAALWRSARDLTPFDFETKVNMADGSVRWHRMRASTEKHFDGSVTWDGVVLDVTEQHLIAEKLSDRDRLLRALTDHMPGMVYRVSMTPDETVRLEYVSKGYTSIFGVEPSYEPKKLDAKCLLYSDGDHERAVEAMRVSARDLTRLELKIRLAHPDGELRWLQINSTPARDDQGVVTWNGVVTDITEQVRRAEALRRSEERFRLASEATSDVIWDLDIATDSIEWSEGLERVFGHSIDAPRRPRTWCENLIHPEDRDHVERMLAEAIRGNATLWRGEYRFRRADGSYADVTDRALIVRDGSGRALRVVGALSDVTARKEAERLLIERDRYIQGVNETVPAIIYTYELATKKLGYVSGHCMDIVGYQAQELLSLGEEVLQRVVHPDDWASTAAFFEHASKLADGEVSPRTFRLLRRDGAWRWVESRESVLSRNADGSVKELVGTVIDVTMQREAQEALRERDERYKQVFKATNDVVWEWDFSTRTILWSESFRSVFGGLSGSLLTPESDYWSRIHPNDLDRVSRSLRHVLDGDAETRHDTYRFRRSSGEYAMVIDRGTVSRDKTGLPVRMIGSITDVSDLRRAEERLGLALVAGHMSAWEWDLETGLLWHTHELCGMFGLPDHAGPTHHRVLFERVFEEDRPKIERYVAEVIAQTPGDLSVDYRVLHPEGVRWLTCQGRLSSLRDDRFEKPRFFGVTIDITERMRTRHELECREERYRLASQAGDDVVWELDVGQGTVHFNEAMRGIFGHDVYGRSLGCDWWQQRVHHDDLPQVMEHMQAALAGTESSIQNEYRFRREDGSYADVFDRARIVRDGSGRPVKVIGAMMDISARKAAERSLQESERRYRELFESSPQPIWVYDHTTFRFLAVNDATLKQYGYSREEFLSMTIFDIRTPEDSAMLREYLSKPDHRQEYMSGRWKHIKKDGTPIHVEVYAKDVEYMGSKCRMVLSKDITKEQEAERALKQSERRLRELVEHSGVIAWEFDIAQDRFVFVQARPDCLLGYTPEQWCEPGFWSRTLHPDDVFDAMECCLEATRRLVPHVLEYRMRRADGGYVWLRDYADVVGEDGNPTSLRGIMIDVTANKESERALRESEERFRLISESTNECFWLHDLETQRPIYVSPAFEKIWGISVQSLIDDHGVFYRMIHPEDLPLFQNVTRMMQDGYHVDYRIIRPDGEIRWIRDRAYPVTALDGRTRLVCGVAEDFTEAREAQETLRRSAELRKLLLSELDHRVKNSLSGLLTLIDLTRAEQGSVDSFAWAMRTRVSAMASVHALLSENHWAPIPLHRLILKIVPAAGVSMLEHSGPEVLVPARQVTAFGMILQELAANSVKHGSASVAGGTIKASWTIVRSADDSAEEREGSTIIDFHWSERGGPMNKPEPKPKLGTRLIQGFSKFELAGEAHFSFGERGVDHRFRFVLDAERESMVEPVRGRAVVSRTITAEWMLAQPSS